MHRFYYICIKIILKAIVHLHLFLSPQKKKKFIGPYEISFIPKLSFSHFKFSLHCSMVKYNCIKSKSLINWVLQFYRYQILFSIIFWIPF